MELTGLPLHPLVVHAAIALVPLAAVSAWVFALVPGWRWLTRWFAAGLAICAVGAVVVARGSGEDLLESLYGTLVPEPVQTHQDRADLLLWSVIALAAVALVAFFLLPARTGLASGRLDHAGTRATGAAHLLPGALILGGALAMVSVLLTGDAGARAHWGS